MQGVLAGLVLEPPEGAGEEVHRQEQHRHDLAQAQRHWVHVQPLVEHPAHGPARDPSRKLAKLNTVTGASNQRGVAARAGECGPEEGGELEEAEQLEKADGLDDADQADVGHVRRGARRVGPVARVLLDSDRALASEYGPADPGVQGGGAP